MGAARIVDAVLLAARVEVGTRGFEVGRIAFGVLMDVNAMLAGRQVFYVYPHVHGSGFAGTQRYGSGILAIGSVDGHDNRLHLRGVR